MTAVENEDVPIYLKLRGLLAAMIIEGRYQEGEQLPSVRAFAASHGANPLTIAKAYQSLQDDGFVTVKRGIGMFVAEGATERLRVHEFLLLHSIAEMHISDRRCEKCDGDSDPENILHW